ncbi:MAG: hypothetical protein IKH88_06825 [Prevotella sp.]|nr:hypothetical protein [Prevotella sp.]
MKKNYIIPETEVTPLFLERCILQATIHGTIGDDEPWGGPGGEGGPGIPADVKKFDLWAEEDE